MRSRTGMHLALEMLRLGNLQDAPIGVFDEACAMFCTIGAEKHSIESADVFMAELNISHRKSRVS